MWQCNGGKIQYGDVVRTFYFIISIFFNLKIFFITIVQLDIHIYVIYICNHKIFAPAHSFNNRRHARCFFRFVAFFYFFSTAFSFIFVSRYILYVRHFFSLVSTSTSYIVYIYTYYELYIQYLHKKVHRVLTIRNSFFIPYIIRNNKNYFYLFIIFISIYISLQNNDNRKIIKIVLEKITFSRYIFFYISLRKKNRLSQMIVFALKNVII